MVKKSDKEVDSMEAGRDMRFRRVWAFASFSILFLFLCTAASGEGLDTRKDELQCGDVLVQAFTTCTREEVILFPDCTEQHFIFSNQRTGTSVRIKGSEEKAEEQIGTLKILSGLAGDWACIRGKAGLYVILNYWTGGNCGPCEWSEFFDLKGRRLATDKGAKTEANNGQFKKKWDALGLPQPWPRNSFTSIKVLKTDK
jgi:hypothetical protein